MDEKQLTVPSSLNIEFIIHVGLFLILFFVTLQFIFSSLYKRILRALIFILRIVSAILLTFLLYYGLLLIKAKVAGKSIHEIEYISRFKEFEKIESIISWIFTTINNVLESPYIKRARIVITDAVLWSMSKIHDLIQG